MKNSVIQNERGMTLMEMLVAISIFSIIVIASGEIFGSVVEGQRNATSAQNIQESMRYALEVMAKEIRSAQASAVNECDSGFGETAAFKVFNTNPSDEFLYFKNKNNDCTAYFLESGRLKINRGTNTDFITPDEIKINSINFSVVDDDLAVTQRTIQPRVTIAMEVEAKTDKDMHKQKFNLQTTVSARYYE